MPLPRYKFFIKENVDPKKYGFEEHNGLNGTRIILKTGRNFELEIKNNRELRIIHPNSNAIRIIILMAKNDAFEEIY